MATVSSVIDGIKSFLTSKYLALTGGTITGTINVSATNAMKRSVDTSFMEFFGGTTYKNGAYIRLDGKDGPKTGNFTLASGNGTTNISLIGTPSGGLTWNSKNVVCVESGTSGNFWYRKYADGWIEQGGLLVPSSGDNNYLEVTVTLPVAFSNTNYIVVSTGTYTTQLGSSDAVVTKKSTTQVGIKAHIYKAGVEYATFYCCGR